MNARRVLMTVLIALFTVMMCEIGHAQDRMPPIRAEQMTDEQKQAVAEFLRLRNATTLPAAFATLLRSPEAMVRLSAVGEYLRRSELPPNLFEFVVLVTARQLDQQYLWDAHYGPGVDAGLSTILLEELAEGKKPSALSDDQRILWDLMDELRVTNRVSDVTYERVLKRFGEKGVIDATVTSGYYMLFGMVMNTAQTPGTGGAPKLKARSSR